MIPYIDMHCDTLGYAWTHRRKDLAGLKGSMVSLEKLETGGCCAQFFAIFLPPLALKKLLGPLLPRDEVYVEKLLAIFRNTMQLHGDRIAPALDDAQLEENRKQGKISAFLTLEDGRVLQNSLERLEQYYAQGIRLISLTWNAPNCLGLPNSQDPTLMEAGLTDFGCQTVLRMEELGMLVDVSHLSDGGFRDVARLCKGPFVASHSNCRSLNPHPRSLTDGMIRTLAEHGGVMGLNFCPEFLGAAPKSRTGRISDMMAQLHHMIQVGGEDCPAIGTDFDGFHGKLEISGADRMQLLFRAMEQEGFSARQIEKIAWGNARRVIREVCRSPKGEKHDAL